MKPYACRPGLLLGSIFEHVPAARTELAELFPKTDIDAMVQVSVFGVLRMLDQFCYVRLGAPR